MPPSSMEKASLVNYDQGVELRNRAADLDPVRTTPTLLLHMDPASCEFCTGVGTDQLLDSGGVKKILQVLRNYFGRKEADPIYQEVARLSHLGRTAQSMGEYLVRFGPLPRKAESRMRTRCASPETSVAILRMQKASLPRTDKSQLLAARNGILGWVLLRGRLDANLDLRVVLSDKVCWRRRKWGKIRRRPGQQRFCSGGGPSYGQEKNDRKEY